jgi:carboxymethylenebutenolidase
VLPLTDVDLPLSPGGTPGLRGVLGVPDGSGPWPGVVLVHEAFGVDDAMRRHVQRTAEAGYLALMPDLFGGGGMRRLVPTMRAVAAGKGRPFADTVAAQAWLAADPRCTGRLGVLGFSAGGAIALLLSRRFAAAAVNYARLPADPDTALAGAGPVVASYGGRDPALRGVAGRLEEVLTRLGVPHDVHEYPGAGHGFLDDVQPGPRVLHPLMRRVLRFEPDPVAAADAWERIGTFFEQHLR